MSDDLVKRPVLRIYTEATSAKGGIWAFKPYTLAHTVFVEESNYLDLKDRIEQLTAERDRLREYLEAVIDEYNGHMYGPYDAHHRSRPQWSGLVKYGR